MIFGFTLPLVAGYIVQQLYSLIDTLIVGQTIGINALAAVGCTGSLMFFTTGFVIGFAGGFSIVAGQRERATRTACGRAQRHASCFARRLAHFDF